MASKKYEEWLKGQKHKPGDKITPFQRLTSTYLPPKGVTTWGEWYKQAGITPVFEDEETPKTDGNTDSTKDLKQKITTAKTLIKSKENALADLKPGTERYNELLGALKKDKASLKEFTTRFEAAKIKEEAPKVKEENAKTKVDYENKVKSWEEKVADAEAKVKIAEDSGGNVKVAQAELDRIKNSKPKGPAYKPDPATTKSSTVKDTDKDGIPDTIDKDPNTPASKTSAVRDTDKDGIPDTIDKDPNTPATKSGGTGSAGGSKGGSGTGGSGSGGVKAPTDSEQKDTALDIANQDFSLPETIFNNVPSLKRLLDRYVKEDWTPEKLRKEIRDDNWFRKNSAEIKARYVQLYNYQDLVKTGQANGSTDYEKQISTLERKLADKARTMGSGLASDPVALRKAAENMYITNVGIDDAMTTDFIAAAIRPITSTLGGKVTEGYSGQALKDYQDLQAVAKANGFKISDILPGKTTEQQVLQGLATGAIDANRLAQDARKLAAQGQPQYVRDLLGQGYNLDQVFAPYKNTMASILEIDDPNSIDLNDPTLRSAINDKGDMNIYDFKKLLKQDNRWQYTENAKKDVADSALQVLRDFGFQG
jgi:hypothetical protein